MPTPSDLPVPAASRAAEHPGPPPLNPGDGGHATLLARLVAEVRPRGEIEEDCVRLVPRLKAKLMTVAAAPKLREILRTIGVGFTAVGFAAVAAAAAA